MQVFLTRRVALERGTNGFGGGDEVCIGHISRVSQPGKVRACDGGKCGGDLFLGSGLAQNAFGDDGAHLNEKARIIFSSTVRGAYFEISVWESVEHCRRACTKLEFQNSLLTRIRLPQRIGQDQCSHPLHKTTLFRMSRMSCVLNVFYLCSRAESRAALSIPVRLSHE
jgi:hypothetical protein